MSNQKQEQESFANLLNESFGENLSLEGQVVSGVIVDIQNDIAVIDIGFKSEGRVSLKDLIGRETEKEFKVGDAIDVFVERLEDKHGEVVLSVEKARKESSWRKLEEACANHTTVEGMIFGRVKGGFAVEINGAIAFLPGSQVDLRPIKDIRPLVNIMQCFKILKMDKLRNNIVVSRRAVLEENRSEARIHLISNLQEGEIVQGVVKNVTDYGAFIDLGGIDGLLHVTDISWKRVNHPSEVLKAGETVSVEILRFNKETGRISLSMKHTEEDPWINVTEKFIIGEKYKGIIVNLADYGAFIELQDGIEGLIYVTELSWTQKNIVPSNIFNVNDEIDVMVLEIDQEKRRVSLSYKRCFDNPWMRFKEEFPVGSTIKGTVKKVTEFGIFIGVNDEMDGIVHLKDISWNGEEDAKKYKKNDVIDVKVLSVDPERERISLGIKQLQHNIYENISWEKGEVVEVKVENIGDKGIHVSVPSVENLRGYIKKSDLSKGSRFAVNDLLDAKFLNCDRESSMVYFSVRDLEKAEMKAALESVGAHEKDTLGDVLKEAMKEKGE